MDELEILKIICVMSGVLGLAVGLAIILVPKALMKVEQNLDKSFSTEKLEKILNERRNVTQVFLRRPRVFGFILLLISFLLVLAGMIIF